MEMKTFTVAINIEAPPEVVFKVVTDWDKMLKMEKGLKSIDIISEVTEGVGLVMQWNFMQEGKEWYWIEEIVENDPPRRTAWKEYEADGTTLFAEGSHTLEPEDNGTATHLTMEETFHGDVTDEWAEGMLKHITDKLKVLSEAEMS